jgi:orotate phosphoribosyltransferase
MGDSLGDVFGMAYIERNEKQRSDFLMKELIDGILRAGLLQFGLFDNVPYKFNFDLLPAYPNILREICIQIQELLKNRSYDRILCDAESVPLGVGVSLQTGVSLAYSRGKGESPVFDLVGAYDVGHPAILLLNIWDGNGSALELINNARRVGLEIQTIVAIFSLQTTISESIEVLSLLNLIDTVKGLADYQHLPVGQAQAVMTWLSSNQPT